MPPEFPPPGSDSQLTASAIAAQYDLHGRTALVTGGAGWLGRPVAKALAQADAAVLITDRDLAVADRTARELREEVEGATIRAAQLDLGDLSSVRRLVLEYNATAHPISLLILAERGLPSSQLTRTRDGFEDLFGRYFLGHLALTTGLLPALRHAVNPRVVSVTTAGHVLSDVDLQDLNFLRRAYDPWVAYGQAQTATCLLAQALTQHFSAEGLTCNAADPGWPAQPTMLDLPPQEIVSRGYATERGDLAASLMAPDTGVATLVWAAVAPELDAVSSRYLRDCQIAPALPPDGDPFQVPFAGYLPRALDPVRALQLWDLSERLLRSADF